MQAGTTDLTHKHRVEVFRLLFFSCRLYFYMSVGSLERSHLGSASRAAFLELRDRTRANVFSSSVSSIRMGPTIHEKIRTQHGIATDFCYPKSKELSLICPKCGINSVRISPPEISPRRSEDVEEWSLRYAVNVKIFTPSV